MKTTDSHLDSLSLRSFLIAVAFPLCTVRLQVCYLDVNPTLSPVYSEESVPLHSHDQIARISFGLSGSPGVRLRRVCVVHSVRRSHGRLVSRSASLVSRQSD